MKIGQPIVARNASFAVQLWKLQPRRGRQDRVWGYSFGRHNRVGYLWLMKGW